MNVFNIEPKCLKSKEGDHFFIVKLIKTVKTKTGEDETLASVCKYCDKVKREVTFYLHGDATEARSKTLEYAMDAIIENEGVDYLEASMKRFITVRPTEYRAPGDYSDWKMPLSTYAKELLTKTKE